MVEVELPERVREYWKESRQSKEVTYSFPLTFLSDCLPKRAHCVY